MIRQGDIEQGGKYLKALEDPVFQKNLNSAKRAIAKPALDNFLFMVEIIGPILKELGD